MAPDETPPILDPYSKNGTRAFFYDLDDVELRTGISDAEAKVGFILASPTLTVLRYQAAPNQHIGPHNHGTRQITYMLGGELRYGNRRTTPGMGYFTPDRKYSWTAGPDGADFIEIHDGFPGAPNFG